MKKIPLKQQIIDLSIFRTKILVIISKDKEHVLRAVKYQHGGSIFDNLNGSDAACFFEDKKSPILWIQRYPKTPKDYGILTHEACHISTHVLENCRVKTTKEDGETYAYLTEYIVEQILKKIEVKFPRGIYK